MKARTLLIAALVGITGLGATAGAGPALARPSTEPTDPSDPVGLANQVVTDVPNMVSEFEKTQCITVKFYVATIDNSDGDKICAGIV